MTEPRIAKTVVADINDPEPRGCFRVDGEPFPWWITEEGPTARQIADDLYLVNVTILVVAAMGDTRQETFFHLWEDENGHPQYPVIQGVEFPWFISEDGITYRCAYNDVPTVELEFLAESVTGIDITDERTSAL